MLSEDMLMSLQAILFAGRMSLTSVRLFLSRGFVNETDSHNIYC